MSTITICDRCRAQTTQTEGPFIELTRLDAESGSWHLCPYCYDKFVLHFMTNSLVAADPARFLQSTGGLR